MNKVIFFRNTFLERSETFILRQILGLKRWHPICVGERMVEGGLPLVGVETIMLRPPKGRLARAYFTICRFFGISHPPSVRKLKRLGARLIHAHFGVDAVDAWPLMRALRIPMVVTLYGYDINVDASWWEAGNGPMRLRYYPSRLRKLAHDSDVRFIAISENIRQKAIDYGIPSSKITLSYLGADIVAFSPSKVPFSQRPKRILFVGRLVEKKGARFLLLALARILPTVPDIDLMVIGDGPLRDELRRLATSLGLPVQFLGILPSDQVKACIDTARLLCVPSVEASNGDAEGLPMIILEAQAAGLPVVTSARGGVGEAVVHLDTGFVFQEGAVCELAEILAMAISDESLLERVAERARANVLARFELSKSIQRIESIYDEVSSQRPISAQLP